MTTTELCGSWRAIEYDHGYVSVEAWCRRVNGPCPYLGTIQTDRGNRPCAAAVVSLLESEDGQ